ncbi:hypothetical protein Taro_050042 [Colocasia esculenta]|uniref:Uncharacterized protein n=1 Tax=Colocasia esculenta TaxID=4460 RepID=A0A843XCD7_COLES|nr:hypothetical protein [Colocasia esculenta]
MRVLCGPSSGTLVLGVFLGTVFTVEVYVVFLDTLTPVFELYVRLRERRQRAATLVCGCEVACSALMVGATEVARTAPGAAANVAPTGMVGTESIVLTAGTMEIATAAALALTGTPA